MLKLKQLQQKTQQAAAEPAKTEGDAAAAGANGAAAPSDAQPASTESHGSTEGFVLKKQNSKELAEVRAKKTGQSVLTLKRTGKKSGKAKVNAAELRAQKDISEMDLEATPGIRVDFPDPNNLMHFFVFVKPNDGLYKGAEFQFTIDVGGNYPYDPPRAECNTLIYHPNIDWQGHVCLNILRADWKPVLTLSSVIFGLMTLFLEPNPDDPLNKEAAEAMVNRRSQFEKDVKNTLRGGNYFGKSFPKLLSN